MKKTLTVDDLRTTKNKNGYKHVQKTMKAGVNGGGATKNAFFAEKRIAPTKPDGTQIGCKWFGPRRATAEEAAQDYCDYINGGKAPRPSKPQLKAANHDPVPVEKNPRTPSEAELAAREILRKERARSEGSEGYIYCIAEKVTPRPTGKLDADGKPQMHEPWPWAVKIGFAFDPNLRIKGLQTGNARPLTILGMIRGTLEDEAKLHARYIDQNILGEWFRPTTELLSEFGIL